MPWSGFARARAHSDKGYRADELAAAFGVSRATIYRLAKLGELPTIKVSRKVLLFPKAAIRAMIRNGHHLKTTA